MNLEELLYNNFDLFSKKLSGRTCKVKNEITRFIELLSKQADINSLGEWFAWYYVAYQFEYYSKLKVLMEGSYPANWIFGKKALTRWNNRDETFWLYHVVCFLQVCEIESPVSFCSQDMGDRFERERKRYFNTDMGLLHCSQFAKYASNSPTCMICKNKKDCQELWK